MIPILKIAPRLRKDKYNNCSFMLSYRYANNRNFIMLGFSVSIKEWNFEKNSPKKSTPEDVIFKFNFYEQKAKSIINTIAFDDNNFNFSNFKEKFLNTKQNHSFINFVEEKLNNIHGLAPLTLKSYQSHLKKIKEYNSDFQFSSINKQFIEDYRAFLIKRGNNANSTNKSLSVFRTFVRWAIPDYIKTNPFHGVEIKKITGNREFLELQELKKFEELYNEKSLRSELQNTLRVFLFCCYTGLRYSDVSKLRFSNIEGEKIKFKQQKTGEFNCVYLTKKSASLLADQPGGINTKIFKVYTNQVLNRNLKEICNILDFPKKLTCHSARHTFATISLNDCKIDLDKVSAALGHTNIATTRIYAHLLEKTKIDAFHAWDEL